MEELIIDTEEDFGALKINNFNDYMKSEDFLKPLNLNVSIKKGELFLMLFEFCVVNSLTHSAKCNLFKFINIIFEAQIFLESRYLLDKLLNSKDNAAYYATCLYCSAFIGKFGEISLNEICHNCGKQLNLSRPSNSSFFFLQDPSTQISDLVNIHGDYYDYIVKHKNFETRSSLKDVYDGNEYKNFLMSLNDKEKTSYLSAFINTDGAEKFRSRNYSAYPIYMSINELLLDVRMDNLITCGTWIGKGKPSMSNFIGTFVRDICSKLSQEGITCTIKNENRNLKLYVIGCVADAIARAPVQGIHQFNGEFGCNWCLHPGKSHAGSRRYFVKNNGSERDHESTVEAMLKVQRGNPIKGVKAPSPLMNLEKLNLAKGINSDYLHAALEGAGKQVTNYHARFLDETDVEEIDEILKKIALPNQVSKGSLAFSERENWSARRWENYILYLNFKCTYFKTILT